LLYRNEYFRETYRYTIQSLAVAPLIYLAVVQSRIPAFRWLNAGPVVYLGKISYTVYLAHQACLFFISEHWPRLGEVRRWLPRRCWCLRSQCQCAAGWRFNSRVSESACTNGGRRRPPKVGAMAQVKGG